MRHGFLLFLIVFAPSAIWIWVHKYGLDFGDEIRQKNQELELPAAVYSYLVASPTEVTFEAADQGDAASQYDVGVYYLKNKIMDKYGYAYKLLENSAEAGIPNASYLYGMKYLEVPNISVSGGIGKVWAYFINMYIYFFYDDYEKAFDYINNAAEQGYVEAQYFIAKMYSKGIGIERNNSEACRWLETAYNNDHSDATVGYATLCVDKSKEIHILESIADRYFLASLVLSRIYREKEELQKEYLDEITSLRERGWSEKEIEEFIEQPEGISQEENYHEKELHWLSKAAYLGYTFAAERYEILKNPDSEEYEFWHDYY